MSAEQKNFFNGSVVAVAKEFSAGLYDHKTKSVTPTGNPGKTILVSTPEGEKAYRVTAVEPYSEADATPIWQGKRADEIRTLNPGETITYNSRSGRLTFIKTEEADNIEISRLEEVGTGKAIVSPSEVTKVLGVAQREIGRLTLVDGDQFRFVKV